MRMRSGGRMPSRRRANVDSREPSRRRRAGVDSRELSEGAVDGARALIAGAADRGWMGPDPYDGLLGRWPAALRRHAVTRQAIVQLHARAPIDLRRLYRRREHPRIAKALALFAQSALRLESVRPDVGTAARGREALELLLADGEAAWGYPFDVQTRWSFYPRGAPNVVVTSFAGSALAEAGRTLGEERLRMRARRAAEWVLERTFNAATGAFSYHEHSDAVIHNANLLAARLVWECLPDDAGARSAVASAVQRSLAALAPDGTWPYGDGDGLGWRDSFHTGFVLGALVALEDVDREVADALARGSRAYADRFFGPRGEARLWLDRAYPEDAHAAGTGLSTLAALGGRGLVDPAIVALVTERVLTSTLRDGHAIWRRGRLWRTHVSYMRWCDAHVALGLADAARALARTDRPAPMISAA